jgi:hypothetical protein
MHRIVEVNVVGPYTVWLRFADGVCGTLDLSELVGKGVFAAWSNPDVFNQATIDPETHTLRWPGGIDLAPEALHEDLKKARV